MALSKKDLKDTETRLEKMFDEKFQAMIDQFGGRMEEIRLELEEKIKNLPTKQEFFEREDRI